MNWPAAFALTCAIEVPLVVAMAPAGLRRRAAVDAFAVNLLTHPLAWATLGPGMLSWTVIEVLVLLIEWFAYARVTGMPWRRAGLAALLANGVTAALSFAV